MILLLANGDPNPKDSLSNITQAILEGINQLDGTKVTILSYSLNTGTLFFYITVSKKKREQNVFVISPTKLGRFWWTLVYRLLNKCASKRCKRFSSHLNNVSKLPCETCEMLIAHMLPLSCYRKKLQNLSTSTVASKFARFGSNPQCVGNIAREGVQNTHHCTALELSTTLLTNGFRNDGIAQL